jgi:hypothetical protein
LRVQQPSKSWVLEHLNPCGLVPVLSAAAARVRPFEHARFRTWSLYSDVAEPFTTVKLPHHRALREVRAAAAGAAATNIRVAMRMSRFISASAGLPPLSALSAASK